MEELGGVRIGDGERRAVVEALTSHREAGRLTPTEFEERQVAASQARTWIDVAPLFTDLPEPRPVGMPANLPPAAPLPVSQQPAEASPGGVLDVIVPSRYRDTVMALTPMLAVLLFFVTRSWYWFLAIPIMGILLYGANGKPKRRR